MSYNAISSLCVAVLSHLSLPRQQTASSLSFSVLAPNFDNQSKQYHPNCQFACAARLPNNPCRAWYSVVARILLKRALEMAVSLGMAGTPGIGGRRSAPSDSSAVIESFVDLERFVLQAAGDSDEFHAAQHLAFVIESLVDFRQLNLAPRLAPNHPALEHAVDMPEVLREKQVIYFYLAGALDNAAVGQEVDHLLLAQRRRDVACRDRSGLDSRPRCSRPASASSR